jgi:ring-1,2-phenylacetyl-CoA epoxidase subunit PaaE
MPHNTKITLIIDGENMNFSMDKDNNILDEALANGIDVPYSCQGGVCTTCMGKLEKGKVIMDDDQMLSDEEINDGLMLTCISKPDSDEIVINYDDV